MRWRKAEKGPAYFKTPGVVLYPLAEVEQFEQANTITHKNHELQAEPEHLQEHQARQQN